MILMVTFSDFDPQEISSSTLHGVPSLLFCLRKGSWRLICLQRLPRLALCSKIPSESISNCCRKGQSFLFFKFLQFPVTPLRSYKKITKWQIWSLALLIVLVSTGIPVFTLNNQMDDFSGFVITYLIFEIIFRLVSITVVEFSRDAIKRETFFLRVLPRASSVISTNTNKSGGGLPLPVYVKPNEKPSAPSI